MAMPAASARADVALFVSGIRLDRAAIRTSAIGPASLGMRREPCVQIGAPGADAGANFEGRNGCNLVKRICLPMRMPRGLAMISAPKRRSDRASALGSPDAVLLSRETVPALCGGFSNILFSSKLPEASRGYE